MGSEYEIIVNNNHRLNFNFTMDYRDSIYLDSENSESLRSNSRTLINGAVRYTSPNNKWQLGLVGKNLTDRQVKISGYNSYDFIGIVHANHNPPRQFFLELKYTNM